MSNEAEKWEKLKEDLMEMKFHESSSNSLRSFDFFTLPNGHVRIVFLGTQWNKFTQVTDLSYVDIDPLWRNHDLTNWKALLKPAQECPNQKI
jgi:hypothetical protein